MQFIELDASEWRTIADSYDAILKALGAPEWHGRDIDALLDSIVYGDINSIEPPYTITITRAAKLPGEVKRHIAELERAIRTAQGSDIEVQLHVDPWKPYLRSV